jgi:hypothetical protein
VSSFVIRQLLPPRLDGKVTLPERDEGLAGIGVLDDEITGVPGKRPILDLALCAGTDVNHIADFRKMVSHRVAASGAGFLCLVNHRLEIAEYGVFQHAREIAGGPEFSTVTLEL